jgi:hypothetical protein
MYAAEHTPTKRSTVTPVDNRACGGRIITSKKTKDRRTYWDKDIIEDIWKVIPDHQEVTKSKIYLAVHLTSSRYSPTVTKSSTNTVFFRGRLYLKNTLKKKSGNI